MSIDRAPFTGDDAGQADLLSRLDRQGIEAVIIAAESDFDLLSPQSLPHVALLDLSAIPEHESGACAEKCSQLKLASIMLVPEGRLADLDAFPEVDDFVLGPPSPDELVARARRIVNRRQSQEGSEVIKAGEMVINPTTYEVFLRGKRMNLRFKEYELLKLLATNPGRVYTREVLLNRIWGYDYIGGTRTVDVHIRRLRSKIEDVDSSYIETIWNVGYRFRSFGSPEPQ